MPKQKISFTGSLGEKLVAILEKPECEPVAYVLFAHCFTCTKDIFSARYLTDGLVKNGCAVLRFDFTGLGESEGEFENTNFSSNVADLIAAAEFLRDNHQAPALLVGHSLGGAAVLAAAGDIPEAKAVATIGAPAEPAHVAHLFSAAQPDIEKHGVAEVLLAGRPFRIKKQFLEDIQANRLAQRIASMKKALLVFHSVVDDTVGIDNARKIFESAKHPKTFVSLDRADHLLSDKRDALYVSDVLAAWSRRYLGARASEQADDQQDEQTVIVESIGAHLAQKIRNGKHEMVADEPSAKGGANTGPTPYGYLLAALGSCTSMTIRLYARLKKIPLEGVQVALTHERIHADDCSGCDKNASVRIERINRVITLKGALSEEQKNKMLAIADKCPVHKTLHATVEVSTRLAEQ